MRNYMESKEAELRITIQQLGKQLAQSLSDNQRYQNELAIQQKVIEECKLREDNYKKDMEAYLK